MPREPVKLKDLVPAVLLTAAPVVIWFATTLLLS